MIKQIILLISFIIVTDARYNNKASRNYLRNLENNIRNRCNLVAYNKTNNQELFNCFNNKNDNCHLLENYSEYCKIRTDCINTHHSECGMSVVVFIMSWVFIGLITNIGVNAR
jgi:hypothetical protein